MHLGASLAMATVKFFSLRVRFRHVFALLSLSVVLVALAVVNLA